MAQLNRLTDGGKLEVRTFSEGDYAAEEHHQ